MTQLRPFAIAAGTARFSPQLFQSLVPAGAGRAVGRKGATFAVSLALHSTLALVLAVLPLLLGSTLPKVDSDTIFAPPIVEIRTLPPPPAAPASGARVVRPRRETAAQLNSFIAPVNVSSELRPDDLLADLDGDPNGVVGGVLDLHRQGNEVGMAQIPDAAPPAPPRVVRISEFAAPQPLLRVTPRYPDLAIQIGLGGVVVVEAEVDTAGHVTTARVLSGHKLLNDAALEAVRQWRYRPLLLGGEPTAFILTVNVEFQLHRG